MLWFYDEPSNDPYVSLTMDVDLAPLLAFQDAFAREHGERIGVQHVVTAAVARLLRELPELNVKIVGRSIYQLDGVHVVVPVHLPSGERGGGADETGIVVVRDADRKSLLEIARDTRRAAKAERAGEASLSGSALARRFARSVPGPLLDATLGLLRSAGEFAPARRLFEEYMGASTGVTNVGAVMEMPPGARFRAFSATLSSRLGHFSSVFALAPAADVPVVAGDRVEARRVLPITAVIDHRAIDGVRMGKVGHLLARMLLEPARLAQP